MEYLELLKQNKKNSFIFSLIALILTPICVVLASSELYKFFILGVEDYYRNILGCIFLTVVPFLVFFLGIEPSLALYINVLIDLKNKELVEEIVVGLKKPNDAGVLDGFFNIGKVSKFYNAWKVHNEKGKKFDLLFFKDVFPFSGKTTGYSYKVTYYKHSKLIVKIEKVKSRREKIDDKKLGLIKRIDEMKFK